MKNKYLYDRIAEVLSWWNNPEDTHEEGFLIEQVVDILKEVKNKLKTNELKV